ncbi:MAG TPA: DUF779 domain-containing protein [Thermoleophilaceae bacterium]|nr:DUF779 domain-containing protein [Thermoleophilaceae bacterium]
MSGLGVVLTPAAGDALERTRAERGEDLTFVIGNGCCDSTAPFLFSAYVAGPGERPVGEVRGIPVLLDAALVDLFAGYEVVIDAGPDPGGDSFSCETELGVRFSMERVPLPA